MGDSPGMGQAPKKTLATTVLIPKGPQLFKSTPAVHNTGLLLNISRPIQDNPGDITMKSGGRFCPILESSSHSHVSYTALFIDWVLFV